MSKINKSRYGFLERYLGNYIEEVGRAKSNVKMDDEMRFLIVEDDEAILESLVDEIGDRGYDVYGLLDSSEMPKLVQKVKPNVFVIDYYLPVTDGSRIIKDLSREESFMGAAFVLMSAYPSVKEVALENSIRCLEKPFSVSALLAEVEIARKLAIEAQHNPKSRVTMLAEDTRDLAKDVGGMFLDIP